jgi:hypothetical protein
LVQPAIVRGSTRLAGASIAHGSPRRAAPQQATGQPGRILHDFENRVPNLAGADDEMVELGREDAQRNPVWEGIARDVWPEMPADAAATPGLPQWESTVRDSLPAHGRYRSTRPCPNRHRRVFEMSTPSWMIDRAEATSV